MIRHYLAVLGCLFFVQTFGQHFTENVDSLEFNQQQAGADLLNLEDYKEMMAIDESISNLNPFDSKGKNLTGEILLGYQYGYNLNYSTYFGISSNYYSKGSIETLLLGLPFDFTYSYQQRAINPSTQNYFRIEFDKSKFLDNVKKEKLTKNVGATSLLDGITESRIDCFKSYQTYVNFNNNLLKPSEISFPVSGIPKEINDIDNLNFDIRHGLDDSLNYDLFRPSMNSDSLAFLNDSLRTRINDLNDNVHRLNQYKQLLSSENYYKLDESPRGKIKAIFSRINKFQIGQVNPEIGDLMFGFIPMNGVNLEVIGKDSTKFSGAHGQLVSFAPLYADGRSVFLNSFISDFVPAFGNIGDRVSMLGITKRGANIIYSLNGLYGLDKYSNSSLPYLGGPQGRNGVLENTIEYNSKNWGKIQFSLAFSAFQNAGVNDGEIHFGRERFYRGQGLRFTWNFIKPEKGLELSIKTQVVGPKFRSLGNPFLRDDQAKAEFISSKKLGKKIKIGTSLKYQGNDILDSSNFKSFAYSAKAYFDYKISKHFLTRIIYVPSYIFNRILEQSSVSRMNQYVSSSVFTKRIGSSFLTNVLSGTLIQQLGENQTSSIYDMNWNSSFDYKGKSKFSFGVKYSKTQGLSGDLDGEVYSISAGYDGRSGDRFNYGIVVNRILNIDRANQLALKGHIDYLYKEKLSLGLIGEKVGLEYYYMSLMDYSYNSFPYLFTAELKILLK